VVASEVPDGRDVEGAEARTVDEGGEAREA
jgi:hypothetical protein